MQHFQVLPTGSREVIVQPHRGDRVPDLKDNHLACLHSCIDSRTSSYAENEIVNNVHPSYLGLFSFSDDIDAHERNHPS